MTKLYFIRHGKTQWNLENKLQGANGDSPLLPESIVANGEAGRYLTNVKFNAIYSSPLQRAKDTAKGIQKMLKYQAPIIYEEGLREIGLGKMEGQNFDVVSRKYPDASYAFRRDPGAYNPKSVGGETFEHLRHRTSAVVEQAIHEQTNGQTNLLFVSHGAALKSLITYLLNIPISEQDVKGGLNNTSITILETKDKGQTFKLVTWNDTHFLSQPVSKADRI